MVSASLNAVTLIEDACKKHSVRLDNLIAETAIWANPEVHNRQIAKTGTAALFPTIRRARPGQGEKRGLKDGVRLDDNNYANVAIKRALGQHRTKIIGFETCHVWPKTCYDCRYHTAIPNLVLIPRALAGLTDHDKAVQAALQYRAFELYGWHPEEVPPPARPVDYPSNWLEPQPDPGAREPRSADPTTRPLEGAVSLEKIRVWAGKPHSIVHSIIAIAQAHGPITRDRLVKEVERYGVAKDPRASVASLMTNAGNAYGRVFVEERGKLTFHPDIKSEIERYNWCLRAEARSPTASADQIISW